MRKRRSNGRSKSPSKPYDVGYKRPPPAFKFQKGVSGNPEGKRRRPKAPDFKTQLQAALAKTVRIRIGKRQKTLTRDAAGIEQLAAQYAAGDRNARRDVHALCDKYGLDVTDRAALQAALEDALSAEDEAILADFVRRHGGQYPVRADALPGLPAKNENSLGPPGDDLKLLAAGTENSISSEIVQPKEKSDA